MGCLDNVTPWPLYPRDRDPVPTLLQVGCDPRPVSKDVDNLATESALDGMFGQRHTLATLPEGQRCSTHSTAGWVRPKAGLKRCGKSGR